MPFRRGARAARSFRAAAITACSQLCRSATDVLSAISLPPACGSLDRKDSLEDGNLHSMLIASVYLCTRTNRGSRWTRLDSEEMQSKGWTQDGRGRWLDPVCVQAARESFAKLERACRSLAERRQRARGVTTFQRFVGSGSERQFAVLPASDDVSTFRVGWSARDIVGCPCPGPRAACPAL